MVRHDSERRQSLGRLYEEVQQSNSLFPEVEVPDSIRLRN